MENNDKEAYNITINKYHIVIHSFSYIQWLKLQCLHKNIEIEHIKDYISKVGVECVGC